MVGMIFGFLQVSVHRGFRGEKLNIEHSISNVQRQIKNEQFIRNLLVLEPLSQQFKDIELAIRQGLN
jgi:hypothetical protein